MESAVESWMDVGCMVGWLAAEDVCQLEEEEEEREEKKRRRRCRRRKRKRCNHAPAAVNLISSAGHCWARVTGPLRDVNLRRRWLAEKETQRDTAKKAPNDTNLEPIGGRRA